MTTRAKNICFLVSFSTRRSRLTGQGSWSYAIDVVCGDINYMRTDRLSIALAFTTPVPELYGAHGIGNILHQHNMLDKRAATPTNFAQRNATLWSSNKADIQLTISPINARQIQGNRPTVTAYNVAETTLRRRRAGEYTVRLRDQAPEKTGIFSLRRVFLETGDSVTTIRWRPPCCCSRLVSFSKVPVTDPWCLGFRP